MEIEIAGVKKKFVLSTYNTVIDVEAGTSVRVTDKSSEYKNYILVDAVLPDYPSTSDGIKPDGTTVVHQVYVLKPTYSIEYYLEVEENTTGVIEIDGRYYAIANDETIVEYSIT